VGDQKITLKVLGMECSACVARVERALNKMEGVGGAAVNFAVGNVTINYDPGRVGVDDLIKVIVDQGYRVPTSRVELKIGGMTCAACSARVERTLSGMEGVFKANVNLAMERATVEYDPGRVSPAELKKAVVDAGYRAEDAEVRPDGDSEKLERERVFSYIPMVSAPGSPTATCSPSAPAGPGRPPIPRTITTFTTC